MTQVPSILLLTVAAAFAQSRPTFEVASIKPSPPLDLEKMAADIQSGRGLQIGARIDGARVQYTSMSLKELIVAAYKMRPSQITGPDWLSSEEFDIVAKIPNGASRNDAPAMLRTLLEDRFKLAAHREGKEQTVMALATSKGGPKLQESSEPPAAIDPNELVNPNETQADTPDGPVRTSTARDGLITVNMGLKGIVGYKMDIRAGTLHMEGKSVTMSGLADILTRLPRVTGVNVPVVDMTGLTGHYRISLDITIAQLSSRARPPSADSPASDPAAGPSVFTAVGALGLKLESRKAVLEQLVVDHIEKTPIGN